MSSFICIQWLKYKQSRVLNWTREKGTHYPTKLFTTLALKNPWVSVSEQNIFCRSGNFQSQKLWNVRSSRNSEIKDSHVYVSSPTETVEATSFCLNHKTAVQIRMAAENGWKSVKLAANVSFRRLGRRGEGIFFHITSSYALFLKSGQRVNLCDSYLDWLRP